MLFALCVTYGYFIGELLGYMKKEVGKLNILLNVAEQAGNKTHGEVLPKWNKFIVEINTDVFKIYTDTHISMFYGLK